MTKPLPSPELLRKLLRYEPETGKLFWRERTPDMFNSGYRTAEGNCANWNGKYAGKQAFTAHNGNGYYRGAIFYRLLYAHRVIFSMFNGIWAGGKQNYLGSFESKSDAENARKIANLKQGFHKNHGREK